MQHQSKAPQTTNFASRIFPGEGEIARLCRTKNWSETPLGPVESWPVSLRSAVGLVVAAPTPMVVLWGSDLIQIYNDGYRATMGTKHPAGLGQPSRDCWPEFWSFNSPLFKGVLERRDSFKFEDQPFLIERHGHPEEAFFTLAYSPVLDDDGAVGGVLVTVFETTAEVNRQRTEQQQRESEERLLLALEAADLGTWDLDLATDTSSSRSLRHDQMFGYRDLQPDWGQEIATRHVLPEDRETFTQAFARAEETGVLSCEVRVRWPDGSIHWIAPLGRTYYDDQGRPRRMAGVVADITDRIGLEALRESEERFRLMVDALPQMVWILDPQGRAELFNRQWSRYTGQSFTPGSAREIAEKILHPDDVAVVMSRFAEAQRNGSQLLSEHRIRSATGEYRWFLAMAEPYRDRATGEISRWIGISVDIHDRKLVEAKLQETSELNAFRVELDNALRSLVDPGDVEGVATRTLGQHLNASRVFYVEIDADMRHTKIDADYCNGVESAVGRYDLADFGPKISEEIHAGRTLAIDDVTRDPWQTAATRGVADLEVGARIVVPLVKYGRAAALLVVHQSKARSWTDTEVKLVQETAERTWAAVERARAERALRESEAKYRTLFESMDQGFGVAEMLPDSAGKLVDFRWVETNPAFERHTGFSASADKTVRELVPDIEHKWVKLYGRVAITGKPARFVEGSDVLNRWFDVYAFPFGEPEQRLVAVLFTDVTERKHNEDSVQRANELLRESDRRKDEFLAMLAHELRNPLAAIANTVKLMERASPDPSATETGDPRFLDILNRQTHMLRGLVDDLLDVSRITRGLVQLKRKRSDLNVIAGRALGSVRALMDEKGHEVSLTFPRKALEVIGDPVRLEQITVNLLTNAAKYTDPGGRIVLSLARRDGCAELCVSDTGIGMNPEVLERIFELFGQAERGLARSEGGLGIGLTIVKKLVELHNGSIRAFSAGSGKGTSFTVSLPLAEPEERQTRAREKPPAAVRREKRILVVEDSEDIANTMALLLEASGHQVALAHDGPSALEKAEEFQPRLILLDIGLPGIDGYEVARRLRRNPRTKNAVLAALTGYGQTEDVERARAAGFARHFTKPVEMERLDRFINELEEPSAD